MTVPGVNVAKSKKAGCRATRCSGEPKYLCGPDKVPLCERHAEDYIAYQMDSGEDPIAEDYVEAPSKAPSKDLGFPEILSGDFDDTALQKAKEEATQAVALWHEYEFNVDDPDAFEDDVEFANQELKQVLALKKAFEAQRKKIARPLDEAKKQLQSLFMPVIRSLEKNEKVIRGKIAEAYLLSKEEKQRQLAEAKRQEARMQKAKGAAKEDAREKRHQALSRSGSVRVKPEKTTVSDHWVFEVTDPDAVPREFLCPDHKAIRGHVQELGEKAVGTIPGVRVYNAPVVTSRS